MKKLKTILLVEDNPQDVEFTIEALSDHHLANHIIAVQDGVEAMDYLRDEGEFKNRKKTNPEVVLLDIKMPRMDGIKVLEAIRKDNKLKKPF